MSTPLQGAAANTLPSLRLKYPGLIPQEAQLFDAWWQANQSQFDSADFNVRVGQGVDPGPAYDQQIRATAIMNSQFRIDAVLSRQGVYYIVEVKIRPTPLAIGQLLSYKVLWMQDNPSKGVPALMMLSASNSPDMVTVAAAYNVTFIGQQ